VSAKQPLLIKRLLEVAVAGVVLAATPVADLAAQVTGEVSFESRVFPGSPSDPDQRRYGASIVFNPEVFTEWQRGYQSVVFEPFLRIDAVDSRRTHVDIRELYWQKVWRDWELRAGIRQVFWGVTESQHLVDIINQTDLVEGPDGEDKLGQPMVNLAMIRSWGTLDFFVLPWFRERTFPGVHGRLRTSPVVDVDDPVYEADGVKRQLAAAVRWSHTLGDWDVGIAHYVGTSRDPRLVPDVDPEGNEVLVPNYDYINQTSIDAQWTRGGWLWKLEGLTRAGQGDRYVAFTGGFEYTLVGLLGTASDLGVLFEYLYDSRGSGAFTPFEDDVFVGMRLALNDTKSTDLLAGVIVDRESQASLFSLEASRRISDGWTLAAEARAFAGVGANDPLQGLRDDHYVQVSLARFF
jgi:hypothetical protein